MKHPCAFSQNLWFRIATLLLAGCACSGAAIAQLQLSPTSDMTLASDALLMPISAPYGRAINGVSFQTETVITHGDYQYATWYRARGFNAEDLMLARRSLASDTWEVMDTFRNLSNGDGSAGDGSSAWDAHNVISMGISTADGRIHLGYDHHNSELNYTQSNAGAATGMTWDDTILQDQRDSLNVGGPLLDDVTYPRYINSPNGGLIKTYRTGGSGNGNLFLASYDPVSAQWDAPHQIINGSSGDPYTDPVNTSFNRNAYLNGVNYDALGNIHLTWTWRESAGGSNHDIMYAYSDDGGDTWRNNGGVVVGDVNNPIDITSPDITVVSMDRTNTLMNQQAQTVDQDGGVHIVMWHKEDGEPAQTNPPFTTDPAAYYHYYRSPTTGDWTRTELPTSRDVGSRPDMAYDQQGNLYVTYVSPGDGDGQGVQNYYTDGDLVIAAATKASGFSDWSILHTDTRDFAGEPSIDQNRLLEQGVLSVFIQENDDAETGRTGTPLHVIEFAPTFNLNWAGTDAGTWNFASSNDWDTTGDDVGNAAYADGTGVTFDDGAATRTVHITAPVAPQSVQFNNTAGNDYTVTGAGIVGSTGLRVTAGGTVTLANGNNSYTGNTDIENGTLALSGTATLSASPTIAVSQGATLDVSSTTGGLMLTEQTLVIDGDVAGNISATSNSVVHINSTNSLGGNLALQSGSLATGIGRVTGNLTVEDGTIRVGGDGLPSQSTPNTILVDDFTDGSLSEYTQTLVLDQNPSSDITFGSSEGALQVSKSAGDEAEQVLLLRGDRGLAVGETLRIDLDYNATSRADIGIAIAATDTPNALVYDTGAGGTQDTREDYIAVYVQSNSNNLKAIEVDGTNVGNTINANGFGSLAGGDVLGLYIRRNGDNFFSIGYTTASGDVDFGGQRFVFNSDIGSAIGFFGDVRSATTFGNLDNLSITGGSITVYSGETLTIDGDFSQSIDGTIELDIHSPGITDLLDVGGTFTAGGTLDVTLNEGAPTPVLGDAFDLLDFSSASGAFDSFVLPSLAVGLGWNTTDLLTTGILSVGLAGDFNGDGTVNLGDYTVWRDNLGGAWVPNRDSQLAGPIGLDDYFTWKTNFGNSVVLSALAGAPVPEPSSCLLTVGLALLACAWRTRAKC